MYDREAVCAVHKWQVWADGGFIGRFTNPALALETALKRKATEIRYGLVVYSIEDQLEELKVMARNWQNANPFEHMA